MKKLLFLVMALFLAGMMFAQDAAHPPGAYTLEAAMSGYSVESHVVTPDTVLVAMPVMAELSSIQAVMVNDNFIAIKPGGLYLGRFRDYTIRPDYFQRK